MPLLDTIYGFHPWYIAQLPAAGVVAARRLIAEQEKWIGMLTDDPVAKQYYVPLGYRVPCQVTYCLPAAVYVMEIRSGKTIHPTLRTVVHEMISDFQFYFRKLALHVDMDPDDWTTRRGSQTITRVG
jgi:hypothetical protein